MFLVYGTVFFVAGPNNPYKSNKKTDRENYLSGTKHLGDLSQFNFFNQIQASLFWRIEALTKIEIIK
jgi:hypothetical protein